MKSFFTSIKNQAGSLSIEYKYYPENQTVYVIEWCGDIVQSQGLSLDDEQLPPEIVNFFKNHVGKKD